MGTGAVVALNLLFGLLDRAQAVGALISKAQAEGRDVSDAELDVLAASDDTARAALAQAIKDARRNG